MYTRRSIGDFSIDPLDPSTFSSEPNPYAPLPDGLPTDELMSFLGMKTGAAPVIPSAPGSFSAWLQKNGTLAFGVAGAFLLFVIATRGRL